MKRLMTLALLLCMSVSTVVHAHGKHDRHAMWQKMLQRTPMAAGAAFDEQGTLWQAQIREGKLWVNFSTDFGNSFNQAVAVNSQPEIIAANGENRPQIAFAKGQVLVAWAQSLPDTPFSGHVRFSVSSDKGKTWSQPANINDDSHAVSHSFVTLLSQPNGVQAVWLDGRERVKNPSFKGTSVFTASYDANQQSFGKNQKQAEHSCECCQIAVAADSQGQSYALWRHIFDNNIRDHALINLNAKQPLTRVTHNQWQIEACPHHGPGLSIDAQDTKHLVWFNQDSQEQQVLFYGQMPAGANKLTKQIGLGNLERQTTYPAVISSGKRLVLAWVEFDGERNQVMVAQSQDGGQNFSTAQSLLSSEEEHARPILLNYQERVFVAWNQPQQGLAIAEVESEKAITKNELKAFTKPSLEQIIQQHQGKPFVLAFWSLDCRYCNEEFALLKQALHEHQQLALELVTTDPIEDSAAILARLEAAGLADNPGWAFAENANKLRFHIDKSWYGELPRTYFFHKDGTLSAHSGMLDEQEFKRWIADNYL